MKALLPQFRLLYLTSFVGHHFPCYSLVAHGSLICSFIWKKKKPFGSFLLILEFPNKTKNSLHRLDMQHGLRKGGGGVGREEFAVIFLYGIALKL